MLVDNIVEGLILSNFILFASAMFILVHSINTMKRLRILRNKEIETFTSEIKLKDEIIKDSDSLIKSYKEQRDKGLELLDKMGKTNNELLVFNDILFNENIKTKEFIRTQGFDISIDNEGQFNFIPNNYPEGKIKRNPNEIKTLIPNEILPNRRDEVIQNIVNIKDNLSKYFTNLSKEERDYILYRIKPIYSETINALIDQEKIDSISNEVLFELVGAINVYNKDQVG